MASGGLSAEEQRQFHASGWLVRKALFAETELAAVAQAITLQLDAVIQELVREGKLSADQAFESEPFETRMGRVVHALDNAEAKMAIVDVMSGLNLNAIGIFRADPGPLAESVMACLRHPALVDCVASLVGSQDIVGQYVTLPASPSCPQKLKAAACRSTFRIRPKLPLDPVVRDSMLFDPGGENQQPSPAVLLLAACDMGIH